MLQTLNPYTPTAKTAEIMARYRPIAPKPQTSNAAAGDEGSGSPMSPTIRQSAYLRNVWPHLQSRPTRTRKRGRTSLGPPAFKRPRTLLQGLSPPFHITKTTLPLLPLSSPQNMQPPNVSKIPEEKDLLAQLQKPPTTTVISPTPIRLIPSSVSIRAIKDDAHMLPPIILKKSEEIEKELESQALPAFVSDSNNQVRLVNSTYKEMVGQPECAWVQSMVACKSICGKVVLNLVDLDDDQAATSGFSCWARIEWGMNGKKNLVNAFGEAMRLACESKDYKFAWRFHTPSNL
ncbi:hypothetical protein L1987_46353 [Smallanthus sonchifolius]|uniref:Uncharacterized protein n=1 Tax=Smallanthus sonchifolius TaxID=185202 RepID=A0ACB9FZC1_9ASTR|nr:hypothetical protein L1987_46353 [Smallanthus sonchifolius]